MITVVYDTRVYVEVEDGEVVRVVVDDEGVQLDRAGTIGINDEPEQKVDAAIEAAEAGSTWPAWEFGW